MSSALVHQLDSLGLWRQDLAEQCLSLRQFLRDHSVLDDSCGEWLDSLRRRLDSEKLRVAFVAEFSRGKSELINALFFASLGRRVMPATPGRTTMCPVELGYDPDQPPSLRLLPLATRKGDQSLSDLRQQPSVWRTIPLNVNDAEQLANDLLLVMDTQWVSPEEATELGLWREDDPDRAPQNEQGLVEVPAWRHAQINYPHPLLKRGLVILDTPGLNAIGAEPELTLNLLPEAHAIVFILAADTGVTKSDLAIWRDHLSADGQTRVVALNKIDTLEDPLSSPETIEAQIQQQCRTSGQLLDLEPSWVYPISARRALAARVAQDVEGVKASRIEALEHALAGRLLPEQQQMLQALVMRQCDRLEQHISRALGDMQRQQAEQTSELRGLKGKNTQMIRTMLKRVAAESEEFEQCTTQVMAMRAVHARMLRESFDEVGTEHIRIQIDALRDAMQGSFLGLGTGKAFAQTFEKLHAHLSNARKKAEEIVAMLQGGFEKLNMNFGFSLNTPKEPDLERFVRDLKMLERNYSRYFALGKAHKVSQGRQIEQFCGMLFSKVRYIFEGAASEIDLWNKTASAQVEHQLKERRRNFKKRHESLERIQSAADSLEERLADVERQTRHTTQIQDDWNQKLSAFRKLAEQGERWCAETEHIDLIA